MKAHNVATLALFVVLIVVGFLLTLWTQSLNVVEEVPPPQATAGSVGPAASPPAAAPSEPAEAPAESSEPEAPSPEGTSPPAEPETTAPGSEAEPSAPPEAAPGEGQTAAGAPSPAPTASASATLGLLAERGDAEGAGPVTLTLRAQGAPLQLGGWRLSDALGEAGDVYHLFYFAKAQGLEPGAPLVIHSDCGRDRGNTLYWCLSQSLPLWDAQRNEVFLRDLRGELRYTCTPAERSETRIRFQCAP